jgi:hypothetical protein
MYNDVDGPSLGLSEQPWLKEIIKTARLPASLDREGAALAMGQLLGRPVSSETLRRWQIPYKIVAGCARYEVSELIAHAKALYENAPRRMGRRGPRATVATSHLNQSGDLSAGTPQFRTPRQKNCAPAAGGRPNARRPGRVS